MTNEDTEFIEYLEQTLIPDLRESGHDATADDFVTMIDMVQRIDPTTPMSGVQVQEPILAKIGEPVTLPQIIEQEQQARNIWERLESLSRSPEQDMVIRRLLNGGVQITTLDEGRAVSKRDAAMDNVISPVGVLIFRDKSDHRWIVDRQGRMYAAGRAEWRITS